MEVPVLAGSVPVTVERRLIEATAMRYLPAGSYAYHYARGKLRHDPLYFQLLRDGLIPDEARVLDLGCGQGILLALLDTVGRFFHVSDRPDGWPQVPSDLRLRGIDRQPRAVRRARVALGAAASIVQADLRSAQLPDSDVIALFDVLHYLPPAAQEEILGRAVRALHRDGTLLLRVAARQRLARSRLTVLSDRLATLMRGEAWGAYHLRPLWEWKDLLQSLGLQAQTMPMSQGTPFANVLLIARRRGVAGDR
jgi:SAM-dependent methyltransferase